jgi:hypothetical protein
MDADSSRWEQRADKDAYALDLLERLVHYFTGRAQATNSAATHAAAAVLSTVSLGLAADDEELLTRLWQAAREVRR